MNKRKAKETTVNSIKVETRRRGLETEIGNDIRNKKQQFPSLMNPANRCEYLESKQ